MKKRKKEEECEEQERRRTKINGARNVKRNSFSEF
jgi:hypothetical protein